MKKLFAQITYSYDNFYNNLNPRGQMIFSVIMFLILVLVAILFINYIVQGIKNRQKIKKILKDKKEIVKEEKIEEKKEENDTNIYKYDEDKTEIQDIASSIEKALMEDSPISLTNFEEDQEKTAIISIDELYKKAKELEMIEDEQTGVNYLEKYNLDASVEEPIKKEDNTPIKSFKVSQVISPVYGVKKEVINKDKY
ncbi:MAG: hypothetical protein MR296_02780 [Tenericutes bacterium]|nr:hypothetical protein [Mycoplasmatota bacterium]